MRRKKTCVLWLSRSYSQLRQHSIINRLTCGNFTAAYRIWKPANTLDEAGDSDSDGVVEMKDGWYERGKGKEFSEDQTMAVEPAGMMVEESGPHALP
jgi:hypothetical protein